MFNSYYLNKILFAKRKYFDGMASFYVHKVCNIIQYTCIQNKAEKQLFSVSQ